MLVNFARMKNTIRDSYGCPLNFLRQREQNASQISWGPSSAYKTFLTNRLDVARNLYRKDLFAHFGCVNAIEFSNEGCWLISGGDDRRVLLWNLEATMSGKSPTPMKEEHSSNIFCLGFDSFNSKIFSAGNDEQVIVHDVRTGETVNVFMHEEAIYGVSVDPYRDSVFASAGEDGQILIFDIRAPTSAEPLQLARSYDAFHAVQFHPIESRLVVTANSKEGVVLWDLRKPCVPFVKYGEKRCAESSMCARFNSTGTQIVALRRRTYPVLFNTQSSAPVCEFDADHYYNSCTMKSCCFAGSADQFVLSGSDDFNLYMWRIPNPHSEVSFIPDAHLILRGHRSIVNQVRFTNHNLTIASSGVEKIVKLWSPVAVPGSYGTLADEKIDSCMTRKVYTHEDYIGLVLDSGQTVSHDYSHGSTDEDPKMMAFFDSLVQREVEGWTTNTDLSDDDLDATSNPTHSSSSLATSQSDDTDSDSAWVSPRQTFSAVRRRRVASARSSHEDAYDCNSGAGGRPKPGHGSEWILYLIAKKRAQLKAAKKIRRNVKKKQKSKARQFIRCFTSSRQYLYRPDKNRAFGSTHCSNRAAPADLLRRRHAVAPYTMMSLGDSDDDESDEEDATPATEAVAQRATDNPLDRSLPQAAERPSLDIPCLPFRASYKIRLWSSDSSLSDDEEPSKDARSSKGSCFSFAEETPLRASARDSPQDPCLSSSETPAAINGATTTTTTVNSLPDEPSPVAATAVRTAGDGGSGAVDGESQRPARSEASSPSDESTMTEAVPIAGVSTDDSGAVLFDLNESSGSVDSASTFHLDDLPESSTQISDNRACSNSTRFISGFNALLDQSSDRLRGADSSSSSSTGLRKGSRGPSCGSKRARPDRNCRMAQQRDISLPGRSTPPSAISVLPAEREDVASPSLFDAGGNGATANTPDSGISVGDRGAKMPDGNSSSESDPKADCRPAFKRKKISEYRLKSYRKRLRGASDEDVKDDLK